MNNVIINGVEYAPVKKDGESNMTNEEKQTLLSKVKFQYVISDPFPLHTQHERSKDFIKRIKKMVLGFTDDGPEEISIWKAYRLGQEEVYKRLEDVPKESGSVAFAYHNAGEKLESYKAFKRENNL